MIGTNRLDSIQLADECTRGMVRLVRVPAAGVAVQPEEKMTLLFAWGATRVAAGV